MISTQKLTILLINAFLPLTPLIREYGQEERCKRFGQTLAYLQSSKKQLIDVICCTEIIPPQYYRAIKTQLKPLGFTYCTNPVKASMSPASSGIVLFSKHPITKQRHTFFHGRCTGSDCLASKGAVYARILLPMGPVNIFTTHLQAWDSPLARNTRHAQCKQIYHFIQSQKISTTEPVILAGDLNTHDGRYLEALEKTLGVVFSKTDQSPTFDPSTNRLVGLDDIDSYSSPKYPEGCRKEFKTTQRCQCCEPLTLDYIGHSDKHLTPQYAYTQVLDMKTPEKFSISALGSQIEVEHVSDHHPVLLTAYYHRYPYHKTYNITTVACDMLLVVFLLLTFYRWLT